MIFSRKRNHGSTFLSRRRRRLLRDPLLGGGRQTDLKPHCLSTVPFSANISRHHIVAQSILLVLYRIMTHDQIMSESNRQLFQENIDHFFRQLCCHGKHSDNGILFANPYFNTFMGPVHTMRIDDAGNGIEENLPISMPTALRDFVDKYKTNVRRILEHMIRIIHQAPSSSTSSSSSSPPLELNEAVTKLIDEQLSIDPERFANDSLLQEAFTDFIQENIAASEVKKLLTQLCIPKMNDIYPFLLGDWDAVFYPKENSKALVQRAIYRAEDNLDAERELLQDPTHYRFKLRVQSPVPLLEIELRQKEKTIELLQLESANGNTNPLILLAIGKEMKDSIRMEKCLKTLRREYGMRIDPIRTRYGNMIPITFFARAPRAPQMVATVTPPPPPPPPIIQLPNAATAVFPSVVTPPSAAATLPPSIAPFSKKASKKHARPVSPFTDFGEEAVAAAAAAAPTTTTSKKRNWKLKN